MALGAAGDPAGEPGMEKRVAQGNAAANALARSGGSELKHSEFGINSNPEYRWRSCHRQGTHLAEEDELPSYLTLILTYTTYMLLIVLGHLRDFIGRRFYPRAFINLQEQNGYASLSSDFDSFYTRRLKTRIDHCFDRPVTGVCGRTVMTLDRETKDFNRTFTLTGGQTRALNISAYNYLGFAQSHGECADAVQACLERYGISTGGTRLGAGLQDLQLQTEKLVARFLNQEAALVVSMGYATNSTTIPALISPGSLVVSDELNHTSLRAGVRLSGAVVRTFKHGSLASLEALLRESISQGQPRTHRPWRKIILIVEGLFSMEGTIVDLPRVLELKKRYKFYLYIDEAHSIGALGPNGGGVCEYFGVDRNQVDIHMGTFTKSFGAVGGYIAGKRSVIERVRVANHSNVYAEAMEPPVQAQIIATIATIMGIGQYPEELGLLPRWMHFSPHFLNGGEGQDRLQRLAFNTRYLNQGLRKLGFMVWSSPDSPVVPLLVFQPGKMSLFSTMMLNRQLALPPSERWAVEDREWNSASLEHANVAVDPAEQRGERVPRRRPPIVVVVVAYPATPLISSRVRFCVSAAHTKTDIDDVLIACDEVGTALNLKYQNGGPGGRWTIDEVTTHAREIAAWDGHSPLPPPGN